MKKMQAALAEKGVSLVSQSATSAGTLEALPAVAEVDGAVFLKDPLLHEEVFGPYSLLVKCKDMDELKNRMEITYRPAHHQFDGNG